MTLQASGTISLMQVNQELGRGAFSTISLNVFNAGGADVVQTGTGNVTINQCSPSRPNGSAPTSMNEWYSYNHNASCDTPPILHRYNANEVGVQILNASAGQQYEYNFREYPNGVWYTLKAGNILSTDPSNPALFTVPVNGSYTNGVFNTFFSGRIIEARVRLYINGTPQSWSTVVKEP